MTEEVVVQKTADEHSEQVGGTVRNTNVEVDEDSDRSAMFDRDKPKTSSERSFDPARSGRR